MNPWRTSNRHPHDCIHCKIHHNHPDSIHTSAEIRPDLLIETLANQSTDTLRQSPDTGRPTQVRYTQGHTQTHIQRLADTHRVTSMDTLGHKVRLWDPTHKPTEKFTWAHTQSHVTTPLTDTLEFIHVALPNSDDTHSQTCTLRHSVPSPLSADSPSTGSDIHTNTG